MTIRLRTTIGCLFLTVMTCAVLSCGKSPIAPDSGGPSGSMTALRISGPSSIAPAHRPVYGDRRVSDGRTSDVTSTARWLASASGILDFPAGSAGRATALVRGEADITAVLVRRSSDLRVLVLEPGTHRLAGTVTVDGGSFAGAVVEVAAGTGIGLRTMTDELGRYAIYGVAGVVDVHVTADGFSPQTVATVVGGNMVANFDLRPLVPPTDITGAWSLTFTASSACSAQLPEVARERRYPIDITQERTRVHLKITTTAVRTILEGRMSGSSLSIPMEGDYGIFDLGIAGIGILAIDGIVTASAQIRTFAGRSTGRSRHLAGHPQRARRAAIAGMSSSYDGWFVSERFGHFCRPWKTAMTSRRSPRSL